MNEKARNYTLEYWTWTAQGAELASVRIRTWSNADFGRIVEQLNAGQRAGTTGRGCNWWIWGAPTGTEQVIDLSGGYDHA